MLMIRCPVCGIAADETEFTSGGPYGRLEETENQVIPRDVVREWWLCARGCGTWFGMARHVVNQRVNAVWAQGEEPWDGRH